MEEKNRYVGNTALNKQCNWRHICETMLLQWLPVMLPRGHSIRSESTSDSWALGPAASCGFALLCGWIWVIWDGSSCHTPAGECCHPSYSWSKDSSLLFYCKEFLEPEDNFMGWRHCLQLESKIMTKRSFSVWGKEIVPSKLQEHAIEQPLNEELNIYNSQKVENV